MHRELLAVETFGDSIADARARRDERDKTRDTQVAMPGARAYPYDVDITDMESATR